MGKRQDPYLALQSLRAIKAEVALRNCWHLQVSTRVSEACTTQSGLYNRKWVISPCTLGYWGYVS
eukprot:scaffold137187_cov45-Prasinocladus_malaysianus.AAC.1